MNAAQEERTRLQQENANQIDYNSNDLLEVEDIGDENEERLNLTWENATTEVDSDESDDDFEEFVQYSILSHLNETEIEPNNSLKKGKRLTNADKVINDEFFKVFTLFAFDCLFTNNFCQDLIEVTDVISSKVSKSDISALSLKILEFFTKHQSTPLSELEPKLPLYRKIAASPFLRDKVKVSLVNQYYIEPEFIPLKNELGNDISTYSYVSITEIVKLYLKNHSIRNKLKQERTYEPSGVYRSALDSGQCHRIRGKFKIDIFSDDAQIAPTNGTGFGNQKYLFVYAIFPDLPPEYCHRIKDIELLMMVKRSDLDQINIDHRMDILYQKLDCELFRLMDKGITIDGEKYEVTVRYIRGDNKGMHEFLGFGQGFQNTSFRCRFCAALGKCKCKHLVRTNDELGADTDMEVLPVAKKQRKNAPSKSIVDIQEEPECSKCVTIQQTNKNFRLLDFNDFQTTDGAKHNGYVRNFALKSLITKKINVANSGVCDPMHELCETIHSNIVEILLGIMKNKLKKEAKLKIQEIGDIFNKYIKEFPLFYGRPKLKWDGAFKLEGKAIQVFIIYLCSNLIYCLSF